MLLKEIEFEDINTYKILVGQSEENLKSIARMLGISISSRGTKIFIKGDDTEKVEIAEETIRELYREIKEGFAISKKDVEEKVVEIKKREKRKKEKSQVGLSSEEGSKEERNGDSGVSSFADDHDEGRKVEIHLRNYIEQSRGGNLSGEDELIVEKKGIENEVESSDDEISETELSQESGDTERKKKKKKVIITTYRGKKIVPKTPNQELYVSAIEENDVVFAFGPAGTGKTYLAVAMAISYLKAGKVAKIVLTRPAVEAGEKIGYLPGGILEKVDPFMRPIYDCLYDILDYREVSKFIDRGVIEVIPIAFMRGRTISDSFIIVDEAQNLTYEQVKMTLTRMGLGSKMVLTADMTQVDIQKSGLLGLRKILEGIEGITFISLTKDDVVRHPVVSKIILAFEKFEKDRNND